jgi:peptidoglycan L-alanyl-D-glutamate endopeptidase CwlK
MRVLLFFCAFVSEWFFKQTICGGRAMSMHPFAEDVVFLQRFLKSAGFDAGTIDGDWGPKTEAAMNQFEARSRQIAEALGRFDTQTEKYVATLQPKTQEAARIFLAKVLGAGIKARIISGTRTYAEQEQLYKKGRFGDDPKNIVTYSHGGQSNHNFGIAWDIGIFQNDGKYLEESPFYIQAAQIGLVGGLEWGGNWRQWQDRPHYQLATGLRIAEVRLRFENGQSYV